MHNLRVWVITEVYYPDEQGGAHLMTELAEGLARSYKVGVLCGYPFQTHRGAALPRRSLRNQVTIERCAGTQFDQRVLLLRVINMLTRSLSMFVATWRRIRKQDVVIVVTTPPLLPFVILVACILVRTKCILRIEDMYPEVLISARVIRGDGSAAGFLHWLNRFLYGRVDRIAVLGRDMKQRLIEKSPQYERKILITENWADVDKIKPSPKLRNPLLLELGLVDKFVVQCAGNMGLAQDIESMFGAIGLLRAHANVHFLFIGQGAKRHWMEEQVRAQGLSNVTLLDQRSRTDQENFLNACDIALVSLIAGMKGAGVPSRMYNIMAAGKPIIAIAEYDSELALVVREEEIGWWVEPGDPTALARAILLASTGPAELAAMGARAHGAATNKYSPAPLIAKYAKLIEELIV